MLRSADWVFAGPGSPTYALAEWRDSPVAEALRDRVQVGRGATVLASAAAVTIGAAAKLTDISGEVKRRLLPCLKAGVSMPRS